MLVHEDAAAITAADFPDEWREGAAELPVSYTFEPGAADDGVTIDVPLAALNTVGAGPFSWNVPGLREELVTALIRSLPKQLRVNFVPAPNVARAFLDAVPPGEEPLPEALARYLRAQTGVHVPADAWSLDKVPAHLRPTFRILDDTGAEVARGKDLDALKEPLRPSFEQAIASASADVAVTGQTSWTFGTVEPSFVQTRAGHEVHGYAALVDEGSTVGLRVVGSADEQAARHRSGVRRLLVLAVPPPELLAGLDNAAKLGLAGSPYPTVAELVDDCVLAAAGEIVDRHPVVRDEAAFAALVAEARSSLEPLARGVLGQVLRVLADWREVSRLLSGRVDMAVLASVADMRAGLERLVHRGFIASAGAGALRSYPRYLAALRIRRERLDAEPRRDAELMARVDPLQRAWQHRVDALPPGRPPGEDLVRVRWLLEEFRVSLWAQQLGTAVPVSDARIRKLLDRA
jgi:ATP-dependent helicase HrpA